MRPPSPPLCHHLRHQNAPFRCTGRRRSAGSLTPGRARQITFETFLISPCPCCLYLPSNRFAFGGSSRRQTNPRPLHWDIDSSGRSVLPTIMAPPLDWARLSNPLRTLLLIRLRAQTAAPSPSPRNAARPAVGQAKPAAADLGNNIRGSDSFSPFGPAPRGRPACGVVLPSPVRGRNSIRESRSILHIREIHLEPDAGGSKSPGLLHPIWILLPGRSCHPSLAPPAGNLGLVSAHFCGPASEPLGSICRPAFEPAGTAPQPGGPAGSSPRGRPAG